jgi:hypothetical protein
VHLRLILEARRLASVLTLVFILATTGGCGQGRQATPVVAPPVRWTESPRETAFLDTLEQRTFAFFWERSDPATGLTPDRWPTDAFASVAAIGFALTAYPIGVERGYVSRDQAAERTLRTLQFLWSAPQGPGATGVTGYHGFYYHFLDMRSGHRFSEWVELSTIDTALLLGGVLFCQSYFDGPGAEEAQVRAYADSIYRRVDWHWASPRAPAMSHGWYPGKGYIKYDWIGYNEAMIVYVLALGSPTFPADSSAWDAWLRGYRWGTYEGRTHVGFAPLFGHQYSHVWLDFRGIRDRYMRERGIDYFENSRRATYAQRGYAVKNPGGWTGYGGATWGLTASDGPGDTILTANGRQRRYMGYSARGASFTEIVDDGTLVPSAAGGSVPFAPEITIPALVAMRERHDTNLFSRYGFVDAYNESYPAGVPVRQGRTIPGQGWFDTDYLGIDQGPIVAMVENYRSGLVWRYMRRNPYIVRGLKRAGFTGGWLDQTAATP